MFRNLFFQSRLFRDFNFTDCLGRVESVSNRSLSHQIRAAYNAGPPDPCFVDTIALSLRMETSARFLKSVDLPLEPRDYLLSKLFQFLYLPLVKGAAKLDRCGAVKLDQLRVGMKGSESGCEGGLERSLGTPLGRAQTEWKPVFTAGGVA